MDLEVKELAERICNSMDKDFGYRIALDMGMDASTLSPGTLVAIARAYAKMPKPEPKTCETCGQEV